MPLGLAKWFQAIGIKNVHEMGWWQETEHPNSPVKLACLPAQVNACDYQLDLVFRFLFAFISALHTVDPMGSINKLYVACNRTCDAKYLEKNKLQWFFWKQRLGDEVHSMTLF